MNQADILNIGQALVAYNPGWCRGFFVTKSLIATAAHCLKDRPPNNISVYLRNGEVIDGSIAYVNFEQDIGLIRVTDNHNKVPLQLSNNHPVAGSKISRAGLTTEKSPYGFMFDVTLGIFKKIVPKYFVGQWNVEMLCLNLESPQQGYSGSPIIYDGVVCGLLVAGNNSGDIFAVPSKYISEVLSR